MKVLYKGKKEVLKYGYGDRVIEFFSGSEKDIPKDLAETLITNCSSDFEKVLEPEKDDADAVIDMDEEKEVTPEPPYECDKCGKKYVLKAHYQHYLKHIETCVGDMTPIDTSWEKEDDS